MDEEDMGDDFVERLKGLKADDFTYDEIILTENILIHDEEIK